MAITTPRYRILPVRGTYAALLAEIDEINDNEICYAIDQDQYYQKEGSVLVQVGATKVQGAKADTAVQPVDLGATAFSNSYLDLDDKPNAVEVGDNISLLANNVGYVTQLQGSALYATAAQGALADSAVQPGDNVSTLTNDAGYITAAQVPPSSVTSVNAQTGAVVLDADDISDASTTNKFTTASDISKLAGIAAGAEVNVNADWNAVSGDAQILNKPTLGTAAAANTTDFATAAQGTLADSSVQPGDTIQFAPGSQSTPGLFPTGDSDSGIFSPGANQVSISTNGDERVRINASGELETGQGGIRINSADLGNPFAGQWSLKSGSELQVLCDNTNRHPFAVGHDDGFGGSNITFTHATSNGETWIYGDLNTTGALGVNGGSYGTSGQVLTSNGSGSAPTWQDAGGGGSYDFVASGTIATGDTVVVNSDGTVSTISGSGTTTPSAGTQGTFTSNAAYNIAAAYDDNANRVVVCYSDSSNANLGTAVAGTINGNTITFGTPFVFYGGSVSYVTATYASNINRTIVAFQSASGLGFAYLLAVSGSTVSSAGSAAFGTSGGTQFNKAAFDSVNNKVILLYRDQGNSSRGTAVVGTVTASTLSFGTPVVFESNGADNLALTFDPNSNKVVIAYRKTNSNTGRVIGGTVSGTTITFDNSIGLSSGSASGIATTFDSINGKVVIAFGDANNGNAGTLVAARVTGSTIALGNRYVFSSTSPVYNSLAYDPSTGRTVVLYSDYENANYGAALDVLIDGDDIIPTGQILFSNGTATYLDAVYNSSTQKVNAVYTANSVGAAVEVVPTTYSSNYNGQNYIGIAAQAIGSGATGKINIAGGVNESQSGLTAGKVYYVDPSGGLSLGEPAAPLPLTKAGTAISSSKIIVKG